MYRHVAVLFTIYIRNGHASDHKARLWHTNLLGRTEMRYEQFLKISPETIEQELRPVDCEQCQTDLRRIGMKSKHECAVQKKPNKITSFATWVHP